MLNFWEKRDGVIPSCADEAGLEALRKVAETAGFEPAIPFWGMLI